MSKNSITKTYNGTIKINDDGTQQNCHFELTNDDMGKYIVLKFRYEEHMFFTGAPLGLKAIINHNELSTQKDHYIYGVYKLDYYTDWAKKKSSIRHKIVLVPVGRWGAWCSRRELYTCDFEGFVNLEYNLFDENPLFEDEMDATKFAVQKNYELYPDTRTKFKKFCDKVTEFLCNIFRI